MQISTPALPGAVFFSREALLSSASLRLDYERAVSDFAKSGDEALLTIDLQGLGHDSAEIAWHIENRGKRMAEGFL